jgi:outer membrane protein assembly factor BamB
MTNSSTCEYAWFRAVFVSLVAFLCLGLLSQGGCSCDPPVSTDAGPNETVPETSGPSPTQIRFIQPVAKEIISGQITIEVEVIDGDGVKEVEFWINGKMYRTETGTASTSTKDSPRYSVQVATSFLPRGVMNLQVKTLDKRGDKAEKTIQVQTRERWVAAFGVGHIEQLMIRKDKHIYLRVYRTEGDISRVQNPGPYDQVGSILITANAIGSASWLYRGLGEEFSPMVIDEKNWTYFGSRVTDTGKNRLIALGPGDVKWLPEVPITPKWETDLGDWGVKSAPLVQGEAIWLHLEKPAQGANPAVSVLAKFDRRTGKEVWRYAGTEAFQISRGPFLLDGGVLYFIRRKAGNTGPGFTVDMVDIDGQQVWSKEYADWRLTVTKQDPRTARMYIGVEKRNGTELDSSALLCVDPKGKKECWNRATAKRWFSHLELGDSYLFAVQNPPGSTKEVTAIQLSDGKEVWLKQYDKYTISGIAPIAGDTVYVFAVLLDDFQDPVTMHVDRLDKQKNINWRYENKLYYPIKWRISNDAQQTLWLIVRNIDDSREQLGTKMLALDNKSKRLYLFFEEARKNQFVLHPEPGLLYLTSTDTRDARIHNLIAR